MALILGPDGSSLSVLLAELLLLFVAADLSDYYGCFGRVEKADGDLRFVARRSRTGELRRSRGAHPRTGTQQLECAAG